VFDTVASLANPKAIVLFVALGVLLVLAVGLAAWFVFAPMRNLGLPTIFGILIVGAAVISFVVSFLMRIKSEAGLPRAQEWRLFHLAEPKMKFYDNQLNVRVGYARHALSIDEARDSFQRVRWGTPKEWRGTGQDENGRPNPIWFEQLWFAGNHSDIGGSYPEDESRLSDISLQWMIDAACRVGLKLDNALLKLHPDPTGPQHDETKSSRVFRIAAKAPRTIPPDALLHPSVLERFKAEEVLLYDVGGAYRPVNLAQHQHTTEFYQPSTPAKS
jgi:hypothetical protein